MASVEKKKLPWPSKNRDEKPPFSPANSDWEPEANTQAAVSCVPPRQFAVGRVVNPVYVPVAEL